LLILMPAAFGTVSAATVTIGEAVRGHRAGAPPPLLALRLDT
jgi:hypothetical protein